MHEHIKVQGYCFMKLQSTLSKDLKFAPFVQEKESNVNKNTYGQQVIIKSSLKSSTQVS